MNKLEWRHQTGQIGPKEGFFCHDEKMQNELKRVKSEEEANSSNVLKEVKQAEKATEGS